MSKSVDAVIRQCQCSSRTWQKISQDLSKISIRPTKSGGYGICYNGIFQGLFLGKNSIIEDEIIANGWTIGDKMDY